MAYRTVCPKCDEPLTVQESYFESEVRCPVCQKIFVPAGNSRQATYAEAKTTGNKTSGAAPASGTSSYGKSNSAGSGTRTRSRHTTSTKTTTREEPTCPFCKTNRPPVTEKNISTAGWIIFGSLLLIMPPLCWIGLFVKNKQYRCIECGKIIELKTLK